MSTSIICPHCSATLNIKDPAVLGKKLRCPKCRQVFASSKLADETEPFDSLDFGDAPRSDEDVLDGLARPAFDRSLGANSFDAPPSNASMWAPPVREVPVAANVKPALPPEQMAARRSRRERMLIVYGGSLCVVLAVAITIAGAMAVWRSIKSSSSQAGAGTQAGMDTDTGITGNNASGSLPTVFGFDEPKRALLVDYLVSQGNGKPKAKLTMAMVVNALKKLAADFNIEASAEFPEQLELVRERITLRDVPEELLHSDKTPAVFEKMIAEYQERKLGPAEEQVAILVLVAFLGDEL